MAEKEEKEAKSLARWDPFGELRRWRPFRESFFPRALAEWMDELPEDWPKMGWEFRPALDVHEDEKEYTVSVELPGTRKEDVTVELKENILTIRGEKKSEREERKEQARYRERRYGSFVRSFTLPSDALAERIGGSFKEGVLTLTIPKGEESKAKTIAIKE